jgi:hypothetical protein
MRIVAHVVRLSGAGNMLVTGQYLGSTPATGPQTLAHWSAMPRVVATPGLPDGYIADSSVTDIVRRLRRGRKHG